MQHLQPVIKPLVWLLSRSVTLWPKLMCLWSKNVFLERYDDITPMIRALRVLEEAMELAQAEGVTSEQADIVRDQVFNKEPGDPFQEFGGVLSCMSGYASTRNYNPKVAFKTEFRRMNTVKIMTKVRTRNLAGDKIGFEKTTHHPWDLHGNDYDPT